jgi:bifunctional N-acetylglutamate synthase/kinase
MRTTQDTIVRLLRNLGSRKEVEQYLRQYSSVEAQKFAVVRVGGGVLAKDLDGLSSSLSFLQSVGLNPIVVHGPGPEFAAALAEDGVETTSVDGRVVTTPPVLAIARRVIQEKTLRLVDALEEMGTRARPVSASVFEAEVEDDGRLGLVGHIRKVHAGGIESSVRAGHLPILGCLGVTPGGQIVDVGADAAARELALALQPFKVVFLNEAGGVLDEHGRVISAVSLAQDYDALLAAPWLAAGMRQKLVEIRRILEGLPPGASVSLTSPDHLAKELFTHTGSGTLVRRGERVTRYDSLEGLDRDRLRDLLEACFRRRLAEDYFDKKKISRIYLVDSYYATAILTDDGPVPYLDKFAVTTQAQGAGVGSSLWKLMKSETPKLFWRARNENEINPWYFQEAQGSFRDAKWTVFYYGLSGWDEIKACVDHALHLPATLREHGTAEV